ncbi:MAG: tRNA pseudouridine(38-40) synthase TruA [Clostridia bacterium]|nr:tRNA pseudouridine(38-40) synthase TruA [Clostridia bacterium]
MKRILLSLSYRGGNYAGFQVQKNAPTVQKTVQDALEALLGTRPGLTGCSRTDAGVHARRYYAAFETESSLPVSRFSAALNAHLPDDISVLGACEVGPAFHPRYDALGKTYRYQIWTKRPRNVFEAERSWHHPRPLDADVFIRLAPLFEGTHDFAGFASAGGSVATTVRTIYRCSALLEDGMLTFEITGNGFLYNMVRIIVGTLTAAAEGGDRDIPAILKSRDRARAGATVPAHGLTLWQVYYPPGTTDFHETEAEL